ncbi:putative C terminal region of Mon2 protein [Trypanosoma vivax]|nr:putative C terminal region of Mon2 protein [Trypanosoma vivax]
MAELLDTIYDNLHKLSFSDVALSSAGMDADEQSRMLEPLQAASGDVSLLLLKEVSRLVQDFGEELRGLAWSHLLQLLRRAAVGWECETTASLLSITGPEVEVRKSMKPRAFNVSAAARQGINVAFRILEAIQHSHITNLDENGLRELVECGGAFMSHRLPPGEEQRLNINLSAVQLLWSVADYSASMDHTQHEKAEYKGMQTKDVDGTAHCGKELWCTLLLQLRNGCLDLRPEVRQGALKTLFTLVQTYSGRLHADCWRCLLGEVLGPLMSLMLEATGACTIAAPPSRPLHGTAGAARPGQQQSTPIKERRSNVEEPQFSSGGCAQVQECTKNAPHWAASLLTHFSENPAFFDDMRLTVMDSVSRVFVSYHVVMRVALVDQAQDEKQRGDGIFLLDSTLARFIELCGTARFVAQTTTGEGVALAAIGALHSLMMVIVGASSREEPLLFLEGKCEAAWLAVEQILRRDDTCIHTASRQCTQSVVASLVTMLGEVVILQRTLNAQRQFCTISTTPATSQSLIGHLLSARAHGSAGKSGDRSPIGDYLPRYIRLVKECLCSQSVAEAYYFPSRVQSSAIEMWKLIWSLLATHERGAVINVTLEQFPTAETLQEFVTQELPSSCGKEGQMCGSRGGAVGAGGQQQSEEKRFISLQDALPRGAHPNFLLALVNFLLHVIQTECSTASQRVGGVLQECVNMDLSSTWLLQ